MKQECQKCGGAMIVLWSRIASARRLRRYACKNCNHRITTSEGNPRRKRLIDAAAVMAIHQSTDGHQVLADQHGCSRELIRQIRSGLIYKDLLPDWFRAPAKAGDPTCNQCRFWSNGCSMGFPDPEIEGPRFARDCSAFDVVVHQPGRSGLND